MRITALSSSAKGTLETGSAATMRTGAYQGCGGFAGILAAGLAAGATFESRDERWAEASVAARRAGSGVVWGPVTSRARFHSACWPEYRAGVRAAPEQGVFVGSAQGVRSNPEGRHSMSRFR